MSNQNNGRECRLTTLVKKQHSKFPKTTAIGAILRSLVNIATRTSVDQCGILLLIPESGHPSALPEHQQFQNLRSRCRARVVSAPPAGAALHRGLGSVPEAEFV